MALVVPSVVRKCRILDPKPTPRKAPHLPGIASGRGGGGQEPARPALNKCPGRRVPGPSRPPTGGLRPDLDRPSLVPPHRQLPGLKPPMPLGTGTCGSVLRHSVAIRVRVQAHEALERYSSTASIGT